MEVYQCYEIYLNEIEFKFKGKKIPKEYGRFGDRMIETSRIEFFKLRNENNYIATIILKGKTWKNGVSGNKFIFYCPYKDFKEEITKLFPNLKI